VAKASAEGKILAGPFAIMFNAKVGSSVITNFGGMILENEITESDRSLLFYR